MADVIIQDTTLRDIAEAVRVRNGTAEKIPVSDIARQIREGTEIEDCENHIVSSTITDWSYYCNNGARLHTLPFIDTSNGTNFNSMCYNASGGWGNNLFDIELNCTKAETMTYAFYGSKARKITLHFNEWSMTSTKLASAFRNASEVTEITITGKIFVNSNDLNLAYCSKLTVESLVNILDALIDNEGYEKFTVYFGSTNLAKLTTEQKEIAGIKNITLA